MVWKKVLVLRGKIVETFSFSKGKISIFYYKKKILPYYSAVWENDINFHIFEKMTPI